MTANQEKIYLEKLSAGWKANKSIDKHPMHIKCELPWNGNLYLWIAVLTDSFVNSAIDIQNTSKKSVCCLIYSVSLTYSRPKYFTYHRNEIYNEYQIIPTML